MYRTVTHESELKERRMVRAPDTTRTKAQRAGTEVDQGIVSPWHAKRLHDATAANLQRIRHHRGIKALTAAQINTFAARHLRVSAQSEREFLRTQSV